MNPESREKVKLEVEKNIEGIFLSTIKIGILHGLLMWLFLYLLQFPYIYFQSCIALVIAIVYNPIASYFAFILGVPYLISNHDFRSIIIIVLLSLTYFYISSYIINSQYTKSIPGKHYYLIQITVVLGIGKFGIQGIIIGPLLICMLKTIYDIYYQYLEPSKEMSILR